jgi:hypothetical protein
MGTQHAIGTRMGWAAGISPSRSSALAIVLGRNLRSTRASARVNCWCLIAILGPLELYWLKNPELALVGKSTAEQSTALTRAVLPLSMRLVAGEPRPEIEVTHADGAQRWVLSFCPIG